RTLKRIVPIWFAIQGQERWDQVFNDLASDLQKENKQLKAHNDEKKSIADRVDTLLERYLNLGGNVIKELEKTIELQKAITEERRKSADEYYNFIQEFDLNRTLTEEIFQENKTILDNKREKIQADYNAANDRNLDALSRIREIDAHIKRTTSDLQQVQSRPSSNIPPKFQAFRTLLANKLALDEGDLPFVAEMVQVKQSEMDWRGAIERAIGSDRLRILVSEKHIKAALRWVNNRENQLHVRLLQANHQVHPRKFLPDGFTHKLNIKNHPLINTVKDLLASRDLHCVNSPDELQTTDHALTMQGMMSGRRGRYDKQDQQRLNENWMTGFDNKDQLETLRQKLQALTMDKKQKWEPISNESDKQRSACSTKLTIINSISNLKFAKIDLPKAIFELEQSQTKLKELLDPASDASQAKSEYDTEQAKLKSLEEKIRLQEKAINFVEVKQEEAAKARDQAANRIGEGLNEVEIELAQTSFLISDDIKVEQLDDWERTFRNEADQNLEEQTRYIEKCITNLTSSMSTAKREDTGALADYTNTPDDASAFLNRLDVLTKEALPEKQERFMEYLNRSSDQGVTQLLASINEEVDNIKERINDLNLTLAKVDFRDGRFLQLQPQHTKDERLRAVERAMQKVRADALLDDQGESHYKSLRELVDILREASENRRLKGSRELLDPRYRLQFFVVEVDRNTLKQSPKRTGSQSGSGGEKELMASHVLTASLSYALCPAQASRPLYGTIVLDEAFSKSSPSAANRIIDALRIFNLHPIFVTPNKEIGLLKKHTRKVICVQRLAKCATLASISWEELEGHGLSK
ncbi:MAG: hypothetical protein CMJ19_13915, partial [Phycisphaeraceae bacterium]|nr:hypothetical protein [Phycisphaeraceae bacterium]